MRGAARGGADGDDTGRGACSAAAVLRRPACWVLHVTHRVAVTCFLGAWDDSPTQLRRTESPRHPELNCFTRELTETAPGLTSGRTRPASGPQDGASRWADHCQPDLSLWVPGAAVAPTPDTCAHGPGLAPSCAITVRDTETRCRVCQRLVRLPSRSLPAASTVTTTFIQPPLSPASRVYRHHHLHTTTAFPGVSCRWWRRTEVVDVVSSTFFLRGTNRPAPLAAPGTTFAGSRLLPSPPPPPPLRHGR